MQPRKEDCLLLLLALKEAYQDASFQEEILQMKEQAKDELGYLTKLGPRAAAIQARLKAVFFLCTSRGTSLHPFCWPKSDHEARARTAKLPYPPQSEQVSISNKAVLFWRLPENFALTRLLSSSASACHKGRKA